MPYMLPWDHLPFLAGVSVQTHVMDNGKGSYAMRQIYYPCNCLLFCCSISWIFGSRNVNPSNLLFCSQLNAANLAGELGDNLASFSSLKTMYVCPTDISPLTYILFVFFVHVLHILCELCDMWTVIVENSCGRDLSNNHIGGTIPSSLPVTLQNMYVLSISWKEKKKRKL